jgi:hypothetical protein
MLNKPTKNWRSYFDYIVVDAMKPLFFDEGTSLKAINIVCLIVVIFGLDLGLLGVTTKIPRFSWL